MEANSLNKAGAEIMLCHALPCWADQETDKFDTRQRSPTSSAIWHYPLTGTTGQFNEAGSLK